MLRSTVSTKKKNSPCADDITADAIAGLFYQQMQFLRAARKEETLQGETEVQFWALLQNQFTKPFPRERR